MTYFSRQLVLGTIYVTDIDPRSHHLHYKWSGAGLSRL